MVPLSNNVECVECVNRLHACATVINCMSKYVRPKLPAPFSWGSRPPSNIQFIGPTRVHTPTAPRSVHPFLQGGSPMCSTRRDKTTVTRTAMRRSVTIDRILCYARPVLVVCPSELRQLHGLRHIQQPQWLGSRVVSVLDSGAKGPRFKSQPRRCRVTGLGKLFTPIVPLFTKQRNW